MIKLVLINTYSERDDFLKNNKRIGYYAGDSVTSEYFNIWIAELYVDNNDNTYSLFLTADNNEQWAVLKFEKN